MREPIVRLEHLGNEFININPGATFSNLEAAFVYGFYFHEAYHHHLAADRPSDLHHDQRRHGPHRFSRHAGATANCNRYYKYQSGDSCDVVAYKSSIIVSQLRACNTDINASCSNFWLDYYICTRVPGTVTPTTTAKTTTAPGLTKTAQQSGAAGNCDKWYKIASGDTCDTVAAKNKITVAMFRSYNAQINSGCNNLLKDYYACVGTPGAATPMPCIVSSCSRFHKVISDDLCDATASKTGITMANLRKGNTQINSGCTNKWLDALICTNA
ncbi:lysM domain-containing protein [Colletotrichum spaethianum]|uniref:LysM domain-containing protein n=1 Tax=Colletotrichum spaethianum TaxID=700344 RepID=A0AA37P8L7_9PEZI|nr:lysM domain-containing protein [Colletotrichum spaethianum]GKT47660.1 lysM domain-containing protein [Colletotrichum spaethianum]